MTESDKPVLLVIMDGWGLREESSYNAVSLASTPHYDALMEGFPNCRLDTSGVDVGLPPGLMGNSEVGHLNLGAGRIVWQQLMQINRSIESGEFRRNPAIQGAIRLAMTRGSRIHLFGLVSQASVHSCEAHYLELIALLADSGLTGARVVFHAFTDGRDSSPHSGLDVVARLEERLAEAGAVLGTVMGRYYAMDRDKRWSRTRLAYEAMVSGKADLEASSGVEAVQQAYERSRHHESSLPFPAETDEFIRPTIITDGQRRPLGRMEDGDVAISFNHRADRPRQIVRALIQKDFQEAILSDPDPCDFPDSRPRVDLVTMTDYRAGFDCPVAFRSSPLMSTLSETVSLAGLGQFHIAETEKYPHVTFFFNGGREEPFQGEDRYMASSPRVATYDLQPEMSAAEVTDRLLEEIRGGRSRFIIVNYANPDMVGHTGVLEAAVKAVETVDAAVGQVVRATLEVGGSALITADHGNCEQMWDEQTQGPHTSHTTNPVPCILVGGRSDVTLRDGRLADVAPTILDLLGLPQPDAMDGATLIASQP